MNPSILNNKDVWAGLLLIAIGAVAILIARNYTFGTALRMGPGFFPIVLGALLIFCSACSWNAAASFRPCWC